MYSAQEVSGKRILYVYELGDDRYRAMTFHYEGMREGETKDYTKSELESLVKDHFPLAASFPELVEKFRQEIAAVKRDAHGLWSVSYMVARHSELRAEGVRAPLTERDPLEGLLDGQKVLHRKVLNEVLENRLRSAEMAIITTTLASKYDALIDRTLG